MRNSERCFEQDLDDFFVLVSYAIEAEDTALLDKWGIEYPHNHPHVLAKSPAEYVEYFQQMVDDEEGFAKEYLEQTKSVWPPLAKAYFQYLCSRLCR